MDALFLLGRILYGGFSVFNGITHFAKLSMIAQYAGSKKVPAPKLAVAGTGLLLLLGGLCVVLGAWPQWGLWLIVVFLVGVTPQIHNFWAVSDAMQRMGELINFTKNVALLGAALALLKLAETQPWPFSVSR
ncbi:MAG: DoxX family membrane protein [Candidatus Acidiferrales bacterium]